MRPDFPDQMATASVAAEARQFANSICRPAKRSSSLLFKRDREDLHEALLPSAVS